MASTINADDGVVSGSAGVKTSADNSGVLELQSNGTTQFTLGSSSVVINEAGADVDFRVESDTNANALFVDGATGNVCVGSTNGGNAGVINVSVGNPGTTAGGLQLWSTTSATHYVQFGDGASSSDPYRGAVGYNHTDDALLFLTATTEKARISSSGNLGLGVTPSAWGSGPAAQVGNVSVSSRTSLPALAQFSANQYWDGAAHRYISTAEATIYTQFNGVHSWLTAPSGTAGDPITFGDAKMTLNASGDLLVGTTSGIYTSAGRGLIELNGSSESLFTWKRNNTNQFYIHNYSSGIDVWNIASTYIRFGTDGTERARITAAGDLLVGTTSNLTISGVASVNGFSSPDSEWVVGVRNANATAPWGIAVQYSDLSPNNTSQDFIWCVDSTIQRFSVRSNGGIANYQGNDADLSDARTKKEITPAASMWDKIGALEIVTYKYNDQTHDDVNVGVIAQQVEAVEPVWVDPDGFGETPEDGVPLKTVYTKDIYFAAIKALQEAMTRIEELEAKVVALESK